MLATLMWTAEDFIIVYLVVTWHDMEWSRENVCKLIELFREKSILWDATERYHKNKQKKYDAWGEIAAQFDIDRGEVENKMKSLIGQFQRDLKITTKSKSGDGTDDIYQPKWFAFKNLLFLRDKIKPRTTREAGIEVGKINLNYCDNAKM
ncbi:hypothetical protein JTB14_033277 [Gonioctena quinquepunctata]|nr:hypothetical protein JTB14_033277 [Gonioctena quinquepunctata]